MRDLLGSFLEAAPAGAGSAAWVRDRNRTAMSREAKSQKNTEAVPVGADSAAWVRDPGRTAMSRQAKSQRKSDRASAYWRSL